jgi:ATP-dependent Clp protease adaptor protein ClpS
MPGVKRLTPTPRGINPVAAAWDRRLFCSSVAKATFLKDRHPELAEGPLTIPAFTPHPADISLRPNPPNAITSTRPSSQAAWERGEIAGIRYGFTAAADPQTETTPDIDVEEKLKDAFARGWSVIVWNDPINLMDYVVYVFKAVLKMSERDASRHMWEVHQMGKSVVARETREKSELFVHRLRAFGLNATLEKA